MSIFGALPLWNEDKYADALEAAGYIRNIGGGILNKRLSVEERVNVKVQALADHLHRTVMEPQPRGTTPMHAGHPRAGKRNKAFFNRDMEA